MFFEYAPGRDIYYEVHGEGSPLLFVPGWTMDHTVFSGQTEHFKKDHRVILFDPPGCGQSSRFEHYDFALYTDVLRKLLAVLSLYDVTLICWSMGGEIGVRYCTEERTRVKRLVLVCSTPSFVQREGWDHGMPLAVARRFRRGLDRDAVATFALFRQETMKGDTDRRIEAALIRSGLRSDLQMAKDLFDEFLVQDERPLLPRLDLPVHIIAGAYDAVCHPKASEYMAAAVTGATIYLLQSGHVPFLVAPGSFNAHVRQLLS